MPLGDAMLTKVQMPLRDTMLLCFAVDTVLEISGNYYGICNKGLRLYLLSKIILDKIAFLNF